MKDNIINEEIIIPSDEVSRYITFFQMQSKMKINGFRTGYIPNQFILFNKWDEVTSNLINFHMYFNEKNNLIENYKIISVNQEKNGSLKYVLEMKYKEKNETVDEITTINENIATAVNEDTSIPTE